MSRVWLSLALAAAACVANGWATFHCRPAMRLTYGATTILAALYVGAFAALIGGWRLPFLDGTDRAAWSHTLSWLGFIVWPLVWTLPAVRETASRRRLDAELSQIAEARGIDPGEGR